MSKLANIVSATIVLIFLSPTVWAAPDTVVPENHEPEAPWSNDPIDENMAVTPPPPVTGSPKAHAPAYYPYRQQLTFRTGRTAQGDLNKFEDFVLGFQYLFPKFLAPKLEAGADLHPDGIGHLHAGIRWIYMERSYFRPSYKIGLDHKADAEERMATLTKIDNYFARLSGTLEYVVWNPLSMRLESEFLVNFKDTQIVVTLALSHGW